MMTVGEGTPSERLDRQSLHEVGQLLRALEANGPQTEEELAVLVGAPYWERHRFHRALLHLLDAGLASRDCCGVIAPRR